MTLTEIEQHYHDEWVLIEFTELDDDLNIIDGKVVAHSPNKEDVEEKMMQMKGRNFSLRYVGEFPDDYAIVL